MNGEEIPGVVNGEIHVVLADAPTDVLVYLADHGPASARAIRDAVAPPDADDAVASVNRALGLLVRMGCVSRGPRLWSATADGRQMVAEARARQATGGAS